MSTTGNAPKKPAPRLSTAMTVVLSDGGEGAYVVETKNVSETGLCLHSEEAFPVGSHLHLVFGQPPDLHRLSTDGVVRWSEGGKGVGVELTSIAPHDHQALVNFVKSQMHSEEEGAKQGDAAHPSVEPASDGTPENQIR